MRTWMTLLVLLASLMGGTVHPLFAEVRSFPTEISIAVWNEMGYWETVSVPASTEIEVEKIVETPKAIYWHVRGVEGMDQLLSERITLKENKEGDLKLNHWKVIRGNPYQQPEHLAVRHALDTDLAEYLSREEREAALTAYEAHEIDSLYVENRSVIYDLGVYGTGSVSQNVMPDWSVIVRDKKREKAPDNMRVVRATYDYVLDGGGVRYHFTGGFVDHYIGDKKTLGCNNVYVHRAEFDSVEVKIPQTFARADEPPPTEEAPPLKIEKRGPSYKLEVFSGIARIGDQGVLFEGGRGVFYQWNPHFGVSIKGYAYQTPRMTNPTEYGFSPFDGLINRWGLGAGSYLEFGPVRSFTHFGRQRFEGEWEPGYFWEEELALHFAGGGLNPTFETLIFHLPKFDYLYGRERFKLDVGHWGPSHDKYGELIYSNVLRLGIEGILHGDQKMLWDPENAGYYYSQGDGLIEVYHRFNSWLLDGVSLVGVVGTSSFGWVYSAELSLLLHDAWR